MNKIKWFIEGFKIGFYLERLEGHTNTWGRFKYGFKSGIRGIKS